MSLLMTFASHVKASVIDSGVCAVPPCSNGRVILLGLRLANILVALLFLAAASFEIWQTGLSPNAFIFALLALICLPAAWLRLSEQVSRTQLRRFLFVNLALLGLMSLSIFANPILIPSPNVFPFSKVALELKDAQKLQDEDPKSDLYIFDVHVESKRLAQLDMHPLHLQFRPDGSDYDFSPRFDPAGSESRCTHKGPLRNHPANCTVVIPVPKTYSSDAGRLVFDYSAYRSSIRVDF